MKRRQYLKTLGATGTAALAISPSSTSAAFAQQPEYVSITYDKAVLEEFQPLIVERDLDDRFQSLYGWVAASAEADTNCAVYFGWRENQEGVSSFDSHRGDREPLLVYYDPDTRDVESVAVDGYHYIRAAYDATQLDFYDSKHPKFKAVAPWAFFQSTTENGIFADITDLNERYQPWLDNGWQVHRQAAVNPWVMRAGGRDHFWRDRAAGTSTNEIFWKTMASTGFFGGDASDV